LFHFSCRHQPLPPLAARDARSTRNAATRMMYHCTSCSSAMRHLLHDTSAFPRFLSFPLSLSLLLSLSLSLSLFSSFAYAIISPNRTLCLNTILSNDSPALMVPSCCTISTPFGFVCPYRVAVPFCTRSTFMDCTTVGVACVWPLFWIYFLSLLSTITTLPPLARYYFCQMICWYWLVPSCCTISTPFGFVCPYRVAVPFRTRSTFMDCTTVGVACVWPLFWIYFLSLLSTIATLPPLARYYFCQMICWYWLVPSCCTISTPFGFVCPYRVAVPFRTRSTFMDCTTVGVACVWPLFWIYFLSLLSTIATLPPLAQQPLPPLSKIWLANDANFLCVWS
jgi:hypothetical protein